MIRRIHSENNSEPPVCYVNFGGTNICISTMKNEKEVQEGKESCYLQGGVRGRESRPGTLTTYFLYCFDFFIHANILPFQKAA